MVEAGLLMGYSGDIIEALHQVGIIRAAILSGAKPADLPALQATKFSLVFNLKTARALGIEAPSGVPAIRALAPIRRRRLKRTAASSA